MIAEGSAEKAGIEVGDIILKLDDITTNSKSELKELIARRRPGDKVLVTILHDGKERVVDVELQNRNGATGLVKTEPSEIAGILGAEFEPCSKEDMSKLGIDLIILQFPLASVGKPSLPEPEIVNSR